MKRLICIKAVWNPTNHTRGDMSTTDELLRNNESYAAGFDKGDLPMPPAKKVAIVACMDARLMPGRVLGLEEGDAHVIRNAGGVITDDEIRSLAISQNLLGTEEIILIHHTDCGMLTFTDEQLVGEREHPAVGVVYEDDLLGAKQVLGDGQRADLVVGERICEHVENGHRAK